jgi:hypothetical protein
MAPWITPKRSLEMEYPEKVYVSLRPEPFEPEDTYYSCYASTDHAGEYLRESEVAVYQLVGKIKLINKTVIAEPDTP